MSSKTAIYVAVIAAVVFAAGIYAFTRGKLPKALTTPGASS